MSQLLRIKKMTHQCASRILFLHGLDSSRESTKFHAINAAQKFCINVDYRNLNYQTVENFYDEIIEKILTYKAPKAKWEK
mgnify:CR=1 FL=1